MSELKFGDYVSIEQKRFGVENEHFCHKVIGTSQSNYWVDVPVRTPLVEEIHDTIEDVVSCICCGVVERDVRHYRLCDVEKISNNPIEDALQARIAELEAELKEKDVLEIRRLHKCGVGVVSLSKMFLAPHQTISHIVNNDTWKYLTLKETKDNMEEGST
jgi:hypothetical protein